MPWPPWRWITKSRCGPRPPSGWPPCPGPPWQGGAARSAGSAAEVRAELAGPDDAPVRRSAGRNTAPPPPALATLAGDSNEEVRRRAGWNVHTPAESLIKLAGDADE